MTSRARQPDPFAPRYHRSLLQLLVRTDTGAKVCDSDDESLTMVAGVPYMALVPVAGLARWRVRAKSSAGLTVTFAFVRPTAKQDESAPDVYAGDNPADLALAAGVEATRDVGEHYGEGLVAVRFTGVVGTLSTLDFMGV